jgi:AbrB family looped-hinge helix DNA binding protein
LKKCKEAGILEIGEGGESIMPLATLTTKGQVTIPKEVREKLHLKAHDKLNIVPEGDLAILRPLRGTILGLKGLLHRKGVRPMDFKKLRKEAERGMALDVLRRAGIRLSATR